MQERGYDVVPVGRSPTTRDGWIVEELRALLESTRPAVIVNAAGALWEVDEQQMVRANQELAGRLVDALAASPGQSPRLVHLGSVYEYGTPPGDLPVLDERSPERPVTAYGRTKLAGTQAVVRAVSAGRVNGVVLRLSTVLGAGAPPSSLFGMLAGQLKTSSGTLTVPDLDDERDILDLDDMVEAVLAAVLTRSRLPVFNIACGRLTRLEDLVRELVRVSGKPVTRLPVARTGLRRNAGVGSSPRFDISAARRLLHWEPRRSPQESLSKLWRASTAAPALL
jgi:nucleoside-diphosphate-sugar epimerase